MSWFEEDEFSLGSKGEEDEKNIISNETVPLLVRDYLTRTGKVKKIEKCLVVRVKRQEEVKTNGDNHFVISKKQRGCGFEYEILSRVSHLSHPTTAYDYYFIEHLHTFPIQK